MLSIKTTHFLPQEAHDLRREVFIDEQGFQEEFDQTDLTAWHLTLYDGDRPAACCRIFPDGPAGTWHVGRVAVGKAWRGQGLGARIMAEAEDAARSMGGRVMALSAQVQAAGFYEKLGYRQSGETYLDEHCPHVHMEKELKKPEAEEA